MHEHELRCLQGSVLGEASKPTFLLGTTVRHETRMREIAQPTAQPAGNRVGVDDTSRPASSSMKSSPGCVLSSNCSSKATQHFPIPRFLMEGSPGPLAVGMSLNGAARAGVGFAAAAVKADLVVP